MGEVETITIEKSRLRVPFARLGAWFHPKHGLIKFSQGDFDAIKANFANDEAGFPPYLTLGHLKAKKDLVANDGAPSKGQLLEIVQDGDVLAGIFEVADAEALSSIEAGEYRYSSAELWRKAKSKKTGDSIGPLLMAVALTNAPFVPNLPENELLSQTAGIEEEGFFRLDLSHGEGEALDLIDALEELDMPENETDEQNLMKSLLTSMQSLVDMAKNFFLAKKIEVAADAAIEQLEEQVDEAQNTAYDAARTASQGAQKAADAAYKTARAVQEEADKIWSQAYDSAFAKAKAVQEAADKQIAAWEAAKVEAMLLLSQAEAATPESPEKLSQGESSEEALAAEDETAPAADPSAASPSTEESVPSSPTGEVGAIMNEELEKLMADQKEMAEKLSALEAANVALTAEKEELVGKLSATAETAEKLSTALAEKALQTKRDELVGAGVPAVMADMALSMAKAAGEQKLSMDGSDIVLADKVFELLAALPQEHRVDLSQHGAATSAAEPTADQVDAWETTFNAKYNR